MRTSLIVVDEVRKRVLLIAASILAARKLSMGKLLYDRGAENDASLATVKRSA